MKPIPIPDTHLLQGARRVTIGAPKGFESTVRPVEALVSESSELGPNITLVIQIEPEDWVKLKEDEGRFFLRIYSISIPAFAIGCFDKVESEEE